MANVSPSHGKGEPWSQDQAFLSSLVHELKAPLATIEGSALLCRKWLDLGKLDALAFGEALDRIIRQSNRIREVIEGLRFLHTPANLRWETLDLAVVIQETLEEFASELKNKRIDVSVRDSVPNPKVRGEGILIKTVLRNLVKNALEAMADHQKELPKLEIRVSSPDDTVELAVQDNGTGMSIEIMKGLFEPYRTTKAWGSGVGLALCRKIVLAHNGRIWAKSRAGRGTTFFVSLPRVGEKENERRTSSGRRPRR